MSTARHGFVGGRVQGVAFRWSTQARAEQLGLTGWVRNLADGRVEAHFEGEESAVNELEAWLQQGPRGARVETLELSSARLEDFASFEIR